MYIRTQGIESIKLDSGTFLERIISSLTKHLECQYEVMKRQRSIQPTRLLLLSALVDAGKSCCGRVGDLIV